jgi:hypothetical protein
VTANRPVSVSRAVTLLYSTVAIGLIGAVIDRLRIPSKVPFWMFLTVGALAGLVIVLFYYLIGKGKNWARMIFAAVLVISLPMKALELVGIPLGPQLPRSMMYGSMAQDVQYLIYVYALVLLFQKPARTWYKRINTRSTA